ncbi:coiled-coil domain-containing protein 84 isoform X1 [Oryzias latipes]|uniref:coiled-coil domain-containing protein 84 isoform X1 n=1 Tax=Oryzias latipes TaxID=8090 RepID=UPI0005CC741D|nr:coiled-coil domain-containing protein 84 isoform X1 [Oryzias latipes]
MGTHYCNICRQTTFSGKKHIFGKQHQSSLRVVLTKFIEKVKEARRTIKKPQVEKFDCIQHKQTFWCYCCEAEVEKNVTDDKMTVLYGGLLEHMATKEHKKNTHKFWWDNKADQKLKDKVLITEEDMKRFKDEVATVLETFVEEEDDFIKQQAAVIRAQEKHRQEVFESFLERDEEPDLSNGASSAGPPAGVSGSSSQFPHPGLQGPVRGGVGDSMAEMPWTATERGLTFIGYQDSSNSGNIHTGAVPPWLQDDPQEGTSGSSEPTAIGPSLQEFLKHKEQEKLRKLPPNRVGANFDHSSHTDANWLPSFGRVWNSGRRWQSRHQFRQEEGQKKRPKRKREQSAESLKRKPNEQLPNPDI